MTEDEESPEQIAEPEDDDADRLPWAVLRSRIVEAAAEFLRPRAKGGAMAFYLAVSDALRAYHADQPELPAPPCLSVHESEEAARAVVASDGIAAGGAALRIYLAEVQLGSVVGLEQLEGLQACETRKLEEAPKLGTGEFRAACLLQRALHRIERRQLAPLDVERFRLAVYDEMRQLPDMWGKSLCDAAADAAVRALSAQGGA